MKKTLLVGALLAGAGFAHAGPESIGAIRVEVGGLRNNRGSVICQLFAGEAGFPETGGAKVVPITLHY